MVNRGDYKVSNSWNVLQTIVSYVPSTDKGKLTRPPLNSTHIEFFLVSVHNCPATTGVMVFGGMCLRPGPSLIGRVGCEGSNSGSI